MFEGLIEQISERFKSLLGMIQETESYQLLKEKFDNLSPQLQKVVVASGVFIIILIIIASPLTTISDSSSYIEDFETKRDITRQLLKASKESSAAPNIPRAPMGPGLTSTLDALAQQSGLTKDQIESISESASTSKLIPSSALAGTTTVQMRRMNLRQIVDFGHKVVQLSPSLKMTSMKITASQGLPGFFDFSFEVNSLKIPMVQMEEDSEATGPMRSRFPRKKTPGPSEDEE